MLFPQAVKAFTRHVWERNPAMCAVRRENGNYIPTSVYWQIPCEGSPYHREISISLTPSNSSDEAVRITAANDRRFTALENGAFIVREDEIQDQNGHLAMDTSLHVICIDEQTGDRELDDVDAEEFDEMLDATVFSLDKTDGQVRWLKQKIQVQRPSYQDGRLQLVVGQDTTSSWTHEDALARAVEQQHQDVTYASEDEVHRVAEICHDAGSWFVSSSAQISDNSHWNEAFGSDISMFGPRSPESERSLPPNEVHQFAVDGQLYVDLPREWQKLTFPQRFNILAYNELGDDEREVFVAHLRANLQRIQAAVYPLDEADQRIAIKSLGQILVNTAHWDRYILNEDTMRLNIPLDIDTPDFAFDG